MTISNLRNKLRIAGATTVAVLAVGAPAAFAQINVDGTNDTTGANSENDNTYSIHHDVDVHVRNNATANNHASVDVEAGNNDTDYNTTVGDISTGDVDVTGDYNTELNTSSVDLMGAFGDSLDVSGDFTNDTTGYNSENENSLYVHHDVDVHLDNTARIDNNVKFKASTGNNDVKYNTTVGDITGGDVSADFNVSSKANSSSTNWNLSGLVGAPVVDANFSNGTTGANSENKNKLDVRSDVDVTVSNNATTNNKVDVDVNTGNNDVKSNTTVGDIHTGSVKINFSADSTAN